MSVTTASLDWLGLTTFDPTLTFSQSYVPSEAAQPEQPRVCYNRQPGLGGAHHYLGHAHLAAWRAVNLKEN